jgi:fructose-1,6-bisphosphatase I
VFDPLDGSSNIEAGLPVGTIFGIYRRPELSLSADPDPLEAIMQPGHKLLASGVCMRLCVRACVYVQGRKGRREGKRREEKSGKSWRGAS